MRLLACVLIVVSGCAHRAFPTPEKWDDVDVSITESTEADPSKAIAAAWKGDPLISEGEPIRRPPSRGWQEEASARFMTSKKTQVRAEVRRFNGRTFVLLAEGTEASLDKRDAQLAKVLATIQPEGMKAESFAGRVPSAIDTAKLDAFLVEALKQLEVPGAAVAIVHHGQVIFERSLGVRALGTSQPITADTLFLMASVTKPMTTFMQASLVDTGLFTFDTKVTTLMPEFALGDATLTKQLALWHMSCACTGMPRRDIENLVEYASVTGEQRIAEMRDMQPTTKLGETFQYSNLMFAAGGFVAAHAYAPKLSLKDAYVKAMAERVFEPLGMTSSTADFELAVRGIHASPHALDIDGRPHELPIAFEGNVVPIAPAGAVWSTLKDMEKYALAELGRGALPNGGKRAVSEERYAERTRRRIGDENSGYALGVDLERRSGLTVLSHDGGADGFGTSLFLIPELELGIVVLTNIRNGSGEEQLPFNAVVKRRVLELLFPGSQEETDTMIHFALRMRRETSRALTAGLERDLDAEFVKSISGTYSGGTLGKLVIRPAPRGATFDVGEWQVTIGRRLIEGRTELVMIDAPFAGTPLLLETTGNILLPDPQTEYRFTRD